MSFLQGLFRTRDAPQNRTSGSTYSFFLGTSTAGKRVNERSAMQMTAVGKRKLWIIRCIFYSMMSQILK